MNGLNNQYTQESFVVGNGFFNRETSKMGNVYENQNLVSGNGLLVKSDMGVNVGLIQEDGNIYLKGKGVYDNSQAGCSADGDYCNGNLRETRDYFCDIGVGSCDYSLEGVYDCTNNNYLYCSGTNVYRKNYGCSGGSCKSSSNTFIQSCTVSAPAYGGWYCHDSDTRARSVTTYNPSCSSGSCGSSSSNDIEYSNCPSNQVCDSGSCRNYRSCSLPWGGSISHGQSVTAYLSGSVSNPQTQSCNSQTRVCNDGVLSGSYRYSSCSLPSVYWHKIYGPYSSKNSYPWVCANGYTKTNNAEYFRNACGQNIPVDGLDRKNRHCIYKYGSNGNFAWSSWSAYDCREIDDGDDEYYQCFWYVGTSGNAGSCGGHGEDSTYAGSSTSGCWSSVYVTYQCSKS